MERAMTCLTAVQHTGETEEGCQEQAAQVRLKADATYGTTRLKAAPEPQVRLKADATYGGDQGKTTESGDRDCR